jgi:hypothetical protein
MFCAIEAGNVLVMKLICVSPGTATSPHHWHKSRPSLQLLGDHDTQPKPGLSLIFAGMFTRPLQAMDVSLYTPKTFRPYMLVTFFF